MKNHSHFLLNTAFVFLCVSFLFVSCKKEKKPIINSTPLIVAPCDSPNNYFWSVFTDTLFFNKDSISNTPDVPIQNCNYHIQLKTSASSERSHFYFTEEPKTGYYFAFTNMTLFDDHSFLFRQGFGSFVIVPFPVGDTLYVDNNDERIIISFCSNTFQLEGFDQIQGLASGKITIEK